MKRTKSGKAWLHEHVTDLYVKRARAEGYRSRAAFKLMEIDDKDQLFKPGEIVVDLGASPGGWSQVAVERGKGRGRVIALDLLEMSAMPGVEFIQGDFQSDAVVTELENLLAGQRIQIVLSDMAPNISGIAISDQARIINLAELGLEFSMKWLKPDGAFLVKLFQGVGYDDFVRQMRQAFRSVATRKPNASKDKSAEIYLLGRGLRT